MRARRSAPPPAPSLVAAAQSRRRHQHALRLLEHGAGERLGRVEPVAVDRDIILAPLDPLDRQPVDELGIGRRRRSAPSKAIQADERFAPPGEAADRAVDPRPRLRIEPVRRILEHRLEPPARARPAASAALRALPAPWPPRRPERRPARPARSPARSRPPAPWPGRRPCRAPRRAAPRPVRTASPRRSAAASRPTAAPAPPRSPPPALARLPRHRKRRPSAAPQARAAARATCPPARRSSAASRSLPARRTRLAKVESAASNR